MYGGAQGGEGADHRGLGLAEASAYLVQHGEERRPRALVGANPVAGQLQPVRAPVVGVGRAADVSSPTELRPGTAHSVTRPTRWRPLAVAALAWAALAAVLFVWTGRFSLAAVEHACGASAPDVRTAPTATDLHAFLAGCGAEGLAAYRDLQRVDLVYPAANAVLLSLLLLALARRLTPRARWAAVLPVLAAAGDYLENAAAWTLLTRGVDGSTWAEQLFRIGSAVKVTATWASWLAFLVLLVWVLVRRVRRGRR